MMTLKNLVMSGDDWFEKIDFFSGTEWECDGVFGRQLGGDVSDEWC